MTAFANHAADARIRELHAEAARRRLETLAREARRNEGRNPITGLLAGLRSTIGRWTSDGAPVAPRLGDYPFRS